MKYKNKDGIELSYEGHENDTGVQLVKEVLRKAIKIGDQKEPESWTEVKNFLVGEVLDNPVYIIPDKTIDISTVRVRVYTTAAGSSFTTFQNIINATSISAASTIYILKESPNGFYELGFGDGVSFGIAPAAGSRIEVPYGAYLSLPRIRKCAICQFSNVIPAEFH